MREEPVIRIRRMYFRNDPIMAGAPPSRPPTEATFYKSFWRSAMVWEELERAGVPDVVGVYCPPEGNTRLLTVVAIRQRYPGHARQAGLIASQCHAAAYLGRFTVVVDDDIDPTDMKDVWWAMTTRCDPSGGHRDSPALLERPARSDRSTRQEGIQFARRHRRLPALRMDQRFSRLRDRAAGPGAASQTKVGQADLVLSRSSMLFDRAAVLEVAQKTRVEKILGL